MTRRLDGFFGIEKPRVRRPNRPDDCRSDYATDERARNGRKTKRDAIESRSYLQVWLNIVNRGSPASSRTDRESFAGRALPVRKAAQSRVEPAKTYSRSRA